MGDLPPRLQWLKALAAGGLLLAVGLGIAHKTKPQGEFAGFWKSADAPPAVAEGSVNPFRNCPTAKCLTVYVAPWCPHCRTATPGIIALRDYLKKHDIHTNIVVGMDKPKALVDYAKQFGPDTLIDEDGALASGGVPHFFVTDKNGKLLRDQAGIPEPTPPSEEFASYFGLP